MSWRVGPLPPVLETIAATYRLDHDEVGLDALMAYTHYTREKGLRPVDAYCATLDSLHESYSLPKAGVNGSDLDD